MSVIKLSENYDSNEVTFFRITYKPSETAKYYNTNLIKASSASESREKLSKIKPDAIFVGASPVFNGSELKSLLDRGMPTIGEPVDEAYIVEPEVDLFDDEDSRPYNYNSSDSNLDWCECNDCGWYGDSDELINNELCPDCGCGDIIREPMTEAMKKSIKQSIKESSGHTYKYNINFGHWIGAKNFSNRTDLIRFLRTHVIAAQSIITESRNCTSDYEKTMHIESNETLKKFNLSPNQTHELFKQGYTKIEKDPALDEQIQSNTNDTDYPRYADCWYGWYQPLGTPGNPNRDKVWVYFPCTATYDHDEAKSWFEDCIPMCKSSKFCGTRLLGLCASEGMKLLDVSNCLPDDVSWDDIISQSSASKYVSEQMQRNPEEDGWPDIVKDNTSQFFNRAASIKYEIDNCVRGAYAIKGDKTEDLISSLKDLRSDLDGAIKVLSMDAKHINESIDDETIEDIDNFISDVKSRFPGSEAIYDGDTNTIKITLSNDGLNESVIDEGVVHNADHISMKISDMIKNNSIDYATITNHNDYADIEFYSDEAANKASKLDWESAGFSDFKVNGSNATVNIKRDANLNEFKSTIKEDLWDKARVTDLVAYYLDRNNVPVNTLVNLIKSQMEKEGSKLPHNITDFYDQVYMSIDSYNGQFEDVLTEAIDEKTLKELNYMLDGILDCDAEQGLDKDALKFLQSRAKFMKKQLNNKTNELHESATQNINMDLFSYILNECLSIYQRGQYEFSEFPTYEEIVDTYDDRITKKDYNKVIKTINNLPDLKFYMSDGIAYLQLSDEHTLFRIDSGIDDVSYNLLIEDAAEAFESKTGVKIFGLGRSGRHICVKNTPENILRYEELCDIQSELEQKVIDIANNYKSDDLDESLKESTLSISDLKAFYNTSTSIDKNKYPNFFAWYDDMVKTGRYKNESIGVELEEWVSNSRQSANNFGSELSASASKLADDGKKIDKFSMYKFGQSVCLAKRRLADGKWIEVGCFDSEKKARKYANNHMNESINVEDVDCVLEENCWTVKPDWDDYCPHCCNRSLSGAGDGHAVCDSCGAEYQITAMPNGRVKIIELEESLVESKQAVKNILQPLVTNGRVRAFKSDEKCPRGFAFKSGDGSSGQVSYNGKDYVFAVVDGELRVMTDAEAGSNWSETIYAKESLTVDDTLKIEKDIANLMSESGLNIDYVDCFATRSEAIKLNIKTDNIESIKDLVNSYCENNCLTILSEFVGAFGNIVYTLSKDNSCKDINEPIINEDINIGDSVKLSTPGNVYYDGRTGVVDFIDNEIATVLFDDGNFPKMNNFDLNQLIKL